MHETPAPAARFPALVGLLVLMAGLLAGGCGDGEPAPQGCRPGPEASGRPASIRQAVDLVNSLPAPVTVECFLESLDRPLYATATHSTISLQPAAGQRSPRLFLLTDQLVMSVAVDGKGRDLVEFGEYVTPDRTLKGEIGFPVEAPLDMADPYARIRRTGPVEGSVGTSCRFCHPNEEPGPQFGDIIGFVSGAFKPAARTLVPLDGVRTERKNCDPTAEPARCQMLKALFDHGPLVESEFPQPVPTFFN